MRFSAVIVLVITSFFLFCDVTKPLPPDYPGMQLIESHNRFYTMGSTSNLASPMEKPTKTVKFTYNYWIDTSEITVEDYAKTTGRLPHKIGDTTAASRLPVRHISWCDAALYCNQRSISAGLDTIYTYTSADIDADNRAYRLNGLKSNLQRTGFRLPTEAEWEFAASCGLPSLFPWGEVPDTALAQSIAWFGNNSSEIAHEVCTKSPNSFGLYDMFGNVVEWVNDYLSAYSADTAVNFTGANFNFNDERPVKGGAFIHTIDRLRPSGRTDSYASFSSSSTAYTGFRCCIGAIPSVKNTQSLSEVIVQNPVTITEKDITRLLPGRNAKLVFVNSTVGQNYLSYIDYNEFSPRVYSFPDFNQVFSPVISPDGRYAAFCTRDDGSRDASEIYIRKLSPENQKLFKLEEVPAFLPRFFEDTVTRETFLVYTTSAVDNTLSSWNTTQTKMWKIVNGQAVGQPLTLDNSGSFHDGLSKDKRFMATGYKRLLMKDRSTGIVKTLFTSPDNGKSDEDTSQVCNVSISSDIQHPDRVLFLDFGTGKQPSTITSSTYETHEILFMSDFSGSVINWYRCPEDAVEWNHPEWSSHPDFAVSAVKPKSAPQSSKEIHLLNLSTKTTNKLVEGAELLFPYLWYSDKTPVANLSADSLGYYNEPATSAQQAQFAMKMPGFWEQRDSIEIMCLGSSRIQNAVIPSYLEPHYTYHLSFACSDLYSIKDIIDNYLVGHCKNLKMIILSIDIGFFNLTPSKLYWDGATKSKGYQYDAKNDFWKTGLPQGFLELMRQAENPYVEEVIKNRGWVSDASVGWGPKPAIYSKAWNWTSSSNVVNHMNLLKAIISDLDKRNIHLLGIVFPMSPHYRDTPVFGNWGPSRVAAEKMINEIAVLDSQSAMFRLYDVNNFGNHDYTDDDAVNESHLSKNGAIKLTTWLKTVVDSMLVAAPE